MEIKNPYSGHGGIGTEDFWHPPVLAMHDAYSPPEYLQWVEWVEKSMWRKIECHCRIKAAAA